MLCAPTDKADTVRTMTVVDDNYTGHVEPQTAARRTIPGASIVKVSVGQMDNNAYLVTCSQTGETLPIDAANDAEILLELIERFAPKLLRARYCNRSPQPNISRCFCCSLQQIISRPGSSQGPKTE